MDPKARISLDRLLPRLKAEFVSADPGAWQDFESRLTAHFERLFDLLLRLYGGQYDFFY